MCWSELLCLSYWDPVNWVLVDGMHNLFLGIARHHFRVVIGMKWDERDEEVETAFDDEVPQEKDLKKGHQLLRADGTTLKQLETLPIPVLQELCIVYKVHLAFISKGTGASKNDPLPSLCW